MNKHFIDNDCDYLFEEHPIDQMGIEEAREQVLKSYQRAEPRTKQKEYYFALWSALDAVSQVAAWQKRIEMQNVALRADNVIIKKLILLMIDRDADLAARAPNDVTNRILDALREEVTGKAKEKTNV